MLLLIRSRVGDQIAEGEQRIGKVNALYCDMRRLNINFRVGEIPDPAHAERMMTRYPNVHFAFTPAVTRRCARSWAACMGTVRMPTLISCSTTKESSSERGRTGMPLIAVPIMSESVSKAVSNSKPLSWKGKFLIRARPRLPAQEDGAVALGHAQNLGNLLAQIGDSITVTLLAELTKTTQVLANLGSGDAHVIAQGRGGDANVAFLMQVIQGLIIAW